LENIKMNKNDSIQPPGLERHDAPESSLHGNLARSTLSNSNLQDIRELNQTHKTDHSALPTLELTNDSHTVKKGETLSQIAQDHLGKGASVHEIYNLVRDLGKINHLANVDKIHTGQLIVFPENARHQSKPENPHAPKSQEAPAAPKPPQAPAHTDKPASPAAPNAPAHTDKPAGPEAPKAPAHTDKPASPAAPNAPDAPHPHPQESGVSGFFHKAMAVASDVVEGAVDEVVHHPGEVLKNAAIGAGVAIGAALLAPEIALGAAVVGIGAGVYEVAKHGGEWIHAADVVANAKDHTAAEQKAAHDELHSFGAGAADLAAGFAGGAAGAFGMKMLSSVAASEVGAEASALKGTLKPGEIPTEMSPVKVVKVGEFTREYQVGGKSYELRGRADDTWYYGKLPNSLDVAPVKVHVTVNGPEDLGAVQKVLIPFLNDNPEASQLAKGWKTFDPNHAFGIGEPPRAIPGPRGQSAKGFTIYTDSAADAVRLQAQLDEVLSSKGLGLSKPIDTGNVDVIEGASNRVGIVRDFYPVAEDAAGNIGARLDQGLEARISSQFGHGGRLSPAELNRVEEAAGIAKGTLKYDTRGKLMLEVSEYDEPRFGRIYVTEGGANNIPGKMEDRPAMYALAKFFKWDLARNAV
jgi:LysM repeat protein